jgi:hypothetical protein
MTEVLSPSEDDAASKRNKWLRGLANLIGGAIPVAGSIVSASAGVWGEAEQERAMAALRAWVKMLEDELREKQCTMLEIISRLDMHDDEIARRVRSDEYQQLLRKAFRNWSGTENRKKQEYIRRPIQQRSATG